MVYDVLGSSDMRETKKLELRTETIMPLASYELEGIKGGATPTTVATSSAWCLRGTIAVTKSSQNCAQKIGEGIARTPDMARRGNDWVKERIGVSF